MSATFFDTPAKLAALEAVARELEGTPFFANSEAPGPDGGMDCVHLLNFLFRALGVIGPMEIPPQVMDHGQHSAHSLLIEAFDTWPTLTAAFTCVFRQTPELLASDEDLRHLPHRLPILPGDVLCFRAGRVPHHGAVMVSAVEFLHTVKPAGAHRFHLTAAFRGQNLLGKLAAIYRPLPSGGYVSPSGSGLLSYPGLNGDSFMPRKAVERLSDLSTLSSQLSTPPAAAGSPV